MDPILSGSLAIAVMLVVMALGVPIGLAMMLVGFVGLWMLLGLSRALLDAALQSFSGVAVLGFTVIPMFILMGDFVHQSGMAAKAFTFAHKWLGGLPGGLAQATTLACALFGAVSSSSIAAVATIGRVAVPEMVDKYKYNRGLASGVIVASGTLAILIPPSNMLAFYAIWVEISIAKQLMAGIIPGIVSAAIYMAMIWVRCWRQPSLAPLRPERLGWNERLRSIPSVWQFALLFLIVVGGIYSGVFSPTEAGATAAFAAMLMLIANRKRQSPGIIREAFWQTSLTTAMIFLLMLGARVFADLLTHLGFGSAVGQAILALPVPPIVALIFMLALYYPLGMVMTSLPILLITLPFMYPVVVALGLNPYWFGIIIIVLLESALITPPVALNIYALQGVLPGYSLAEIVRGILWFLAMDMLTVAILFAFPVISTWLPGQMFGAGR